MAHDPPFPRPRATDPADGDQRQFGHQRLGLRRHGSYHHPVSRWNGSRWASFRFPRQLLTTAAAVFSRTDVWAFGEKFIPSTASSRPYVVRFTGRRWLPVPSPLVPQAASAVAPDDIWTVGPLTGMSAASPRGLPLRAG